MKKILLTFCIAVLSGLCFAQQPAPLIWGVSPGSNDLYSADTLNWSFSANLPTTVTGSVITGMTGLAYDPTTYKSYVIAKIGSNRYLAEINLANGSCTVIGNLGDNFASITFDSSGQLWGATGDGSIIAPETLFRINKANAATTLAFGMGNGDDGENICYNRFDNKMYHWSGNNTVIYESWPITNTTYAPTNISTSGNLSDETTGALCLTANQFIASTIDSEYQYLSSTGFYGNPVSANPDVLRGVIMPPRFAASPSTVCANSTSVGLYSNCLQLFDSVYYYWGDGNVTQRLATSASTALTAHSYSVQGTFTINIMLYNGAVPKSTFTTFTVLVNPSPSVTVTGGGTVCPGQSITLTASGGGASQWYKGGLAVPNATNNTLNATTPGWYNMIKTNLSGCSDSADTGVLVIQAPGATISVSNGTICTGSSFGINPSGAATYTIQGGSATVSPTVTTSYSVTGTSTAGCVSSNTAVATVVVMPLPTITVVSSKPTICVGETAVLTASGATQYQWQSAGTANTLAVTPTVSTTYVVAGVGLQGFCSNTVSITQAVSDCAGLAEKTAAAHIRVMPNPGTGKFIIENVSEGASIEVYDALGKLVLKTAAHGEKTSLDLGDQNAGIYFLRVGLRERTVGQIRIIKQ